MSLLQMLAHAREISHRSLDVNESAIHGWIQRRTIGMS